MDEITSDKLELLRTALPKGLSAGDGGIASFPEKPFAQPMNWPQFQTTTTDTKLYTESPTITEEPQTIQSQAATDIIHPWKIYKTTSNDVTQVKIEYNSNVYSGTGSYDNIAVTGLDSWTQAETGYVVLKGSVSNHEITSLSIVWGDDGSTQRAEFNSNNEQTDVTIRLGYIYQDENDAWQIRQDVFGQLTIITTCYQTKPCLCFIQT